MVPTYSRKDFDAIHESGLLVKIKSSVLPSNVGAGTTCSNPCPVAISNIVWWRQGRDDPSFT